MLRAQQVPTAACTLDIVGNAFVNQYYHILHQSPEYVHRFYQKISKVRPFEENGIMSITSTLQTSPVMLNGHKVVVEEKRSTARGNYRGRSTFGVNTCYRNAGGRGHGSFGGGRGGYGRADFIGYGNNRGNNIGGYANRANGDGGGFPRANGKNGRARRGGGIDANRATKPVDDAPSVSVTA